MTRPEIEPWSPEPLMNTLLIRLMARIIILTRNWKSSSKFYVWIYFYYAFLLIKRFLYWYDLGLWKLLVHSLNTFLHRISTFVNHQKYLWIETSVLILVVIIVTKFKLLYSLTRRLFLFLFLKHLMLTLLEMMTYTSCYNKQLQFRRWRLILLKIIKKISFILEKIFLQFQHK